MTGKSKLCYANSSKKLEKRVKRRAGNRAFIPVYMWVGLTWPIPHPFYHWIVSLFFLQEPRGSATTELAVCCLL